MDKKDIKKIDNEMLLFFLVVSIFSFLIYLTKHPLFFVFEKGINQKSLFMIYFLDFFIFVFMLFPYVVALIILIFLSLVKGLVIKDDFFLLLFFPLLSFFSKGMYLPEIYVDDNIFYILKTNISFFSFIIIGFVLTLIQRYYKKKRG